MAMYHIFIIYQMFAFLTNSAGQCFWSRLPLYVMPLKASTQKVHFYAIVSNVTGICCHKSVCRLSLCNVRVPYSAD